MTDKIHGVVVVLENDIKIDAAEAGILLALRQLRGVIDVRPITVDFTNQIIRSQVRNELLTKLLKLLTDG
jgi:hypothetical protein